jgi:pimeloyl-ACP methyl ester carboxylesterase
MFGLDVVEKFFNFIRTSYEMNPAIWSRLWKTVVTNPFLVPISSMVGGFNLQLTSLKDVQIYARGVAAMDMKVFMVLFEELMAYDGEPVLPRITCPTLIISGQKDGVTPIKYQEGMHERIQGSEFVLVPYGSHCTQLDFPEFVNLRIEKFYSRLSWPPKRKPAPRA